MLLVVDLIAFFDWLVVCVGILLLCLVVVWTVCCGLLIVLC